MESESAAHRDGNIASGKYNLDDLDDEMFPHSRSLIERMISRDPKQRPTASEVLQHSMFQNKEARGLIKIVKNGIRNQFGCCFSLNGHSCRFIEMFNSTMGTTLFESTEAIYGKDWVKKIRNRFKDGRIKPKDKVVILSGTHGQILSGAQVATTALTDKENASSSFHREDIAFIGELKKEFPKHRYIEVIDVANYHLREYELTEKVRLMKPQFLVYAFCDSINCVDVKNLFKKVGTHQQLSIPLQQQAEPPLPNSYSRSSSMEMDAFENPEERGLNSSSGLKAVWVAGRHWLAVVAGWPEHLVCLSVALAVFRVVTDFWAMTGWLAVLVFLALIDRLWSPDWLAVVAGWLKNLVCLAVALPVRLWPTDWLTVAKDGRDIDMEAELCKRFSKVKVSNSQLEEANKVISNLHLERYEEDMVLKIHRGVKLSDFDKYINLLCASLNLSQQHEKQMRAELQISELVDYKCDSPMKVNFDVNEFESVYGFWCAIKEGNNKVTIAYAIHKLKFKISENEIKRENLTFGQMKAVRNTISTHEALTKLKDEGIINTIIYEK